METQTPKKNILKIYNSRLGGKIGFYETRFSIEIDEKDDLIIAESLFNSIDSDMCNTQQYLDKLKHKDEIIITILIIQVKKLRKKYVILAVFRNRGVANYKTPTNQNNNLKFLISNCNPPKN